MSETASPTVTPRATDALLTDGRHVSGLVDETTGIFVYLDLKSRRAVTVHPANGKGGLGWVSLTDASGSVSSHYYS